MTTSTSPLATIPLRSKANLVPSSLSTPATPPPVQSGVGCWLHGPAATGFHGDVVGQAMAPAELGGVSLWTASMRIGNDSPSPRWKRTAETASGPDALLDRYRPPGGTCGGGGSWPESGWAFHQ